MAPALRRGRLAQDGIGAQEASEGWRAETPDRVVELPRRRTAVFIALLAGKFECEVVLRRIGRFFAKGIVARNTTC